MLEIKSLCIEDSLKNPLLKDINLKLNQGEIIGITGNSGSGKTTLIKSILGMLNNDLKIVKGEIFIDNINLSSLKRKERRNINGTLIGYIPQNPMTVFDSRFKVGDQMIEIFTHRTKMTRNQAEKLTISKLLKVNLKDTNRVMNSYPFELSGGMLQRAAVAVVLGLSPGYILADEPTSALDEENRDILINIIKKDMNNKGILFISHDIHALEELTNHVLVLNKGEIIEDGSMTALLNNPKEEWTKRFAEVKNHEDLEEWQWKAC